MKIALDKKILSGFIFCSIILLIVGILSLRNSEKFITTNFWVNHTQEVLYEFEQILINSVDAETGMRGFVITGTENYLEPFDDSKLKVIEHISRLAELIKDNDIQQKNLARIQSLIEQRLKVLEIGIELRRTKGFEKAKEYISLGEGKRLQDEIREIVAQSKDIEQKLLAERKQASDADARNFNLIFIGLLIVITVILAIVYFIIRANLNALRTAQAETANKNWSLQGSTDLIRSMQGNKILTEAAQIIISQLASYLNMLAGALYVADDTNTHLKLQAVYGLNKQLPELAMINFGEGIVGQAAIEKRNVFITNIPNNHLQVKTSFGDVLPKHIIASPIIFEDRVVGVIELASIHDLTDLQKQFIELVMDNIATCITSAQARHRTYELLEETQRQAEEMEAQQEELRQSNEELHAKTELLENSELKLKVQQEELTQTNEELEKKANALEGQNEKLENAKHEIEIKASEIEATSKYKSDFLANMSHELRTPLNSILILAQLLSDNRNETLAEKEVEFAKNIFNSGTDLLNLIDEILDLSKVEAGKIQLEIGAVPFTDIIHHLKATFSEVATSKGIDFEIDFKDNDLPAEIETDPQRLKQIIKNLLSNAFKFTSRGGKVSVTINRESSKNNSSARVIFSISDTGIGIPRAKRSLIFEAFQQADSSTKRKYGGTGLGLSISQEFAHALGGEIQLQSEEEKGSTFSLLLPLRFDSGLISSPARNVEIKDSQKIKEIKKPVETVIPSNPVDDDRHSLVKDDKIILIIEDEIQFAVVLLTMVRERGYKGIVANRGNTGLAYTRHYNPNIILLDIKLQDIEGFEVLKQLKMDPDLRHIPVQIISAYDHRKKGFELGAFDYIIKPITLANLGKALDRIEKFIKEKPKKLLIIEDNQQQNKALCELLGQEGDVKCHSAYRGTEAYAMMEMEAYDCFIVDLGLPDMSGYDLLEKIKANPKLNKIPIIVYTGKDLTKDDSLHLNKLANTVVLKTVDSQERLLDETMLLLHRDEAQLPKEKQTILRNLHKNDGALKNKKILLVDDDIRNIYSLTNALEEEGIHCITAENGKVALKVLQENNSIDLILMDIMMPEMDGYEATLEIRKLNRFKKLPIIALTAKAMKGDKEKCLAVGMSDYVSKPVNIEKLISLLRVWLYR